MDDGIILDGRGEGEHDENTKEKQEEKELNSRWVP